MIRQRLFLVFLLLVSFGAVTAQKTSSAIRSFAPGFCDPIQEISKAYFDSHQKKLSVIDTTDIPLKKGNRIAVKFGKDSLVFRYKSYETDSGFMLYNAIVGIDKKRDWVLVQSGDEIMSIYYLIDQQNMTIDTLIGYPYLVANRMISIEEEHTDWPGCIEVRGIQNRKTNIIFKDYFGRCEQAHGLQAFAISSQKEFMFYGWGKYWIIKGALF